MNAKHVGGWTAVGIGIGAAMGSATGEMGVWVALGAALGVSVGFTIDATRRKKCRAFTLPKAEFQSERLK
jgi:hypothetical protein